MPLLAVFAGCHSAPPPKPPFAPPTAASITREEPGGNSNDPHAAALQRLVSEPWGWRNDKADVFHVPLPDPANWRRVRYIGVTSFVGFRYGDAHHAVIAVWVRPAPGGAATADGCLSDFEDWGRPTARSFSVEITPGATIRTTSPNGEMAIRSVDAEINTLFAKKHYRAAYAAYAMWPGTCTIFGIAVPVRGSDELARAVRDRFIGEGFARLERRSAAPPAPQ